MNQDKIKKFNYELQKQHQGSPETIKLSFYHIPYRLFLAGAFIMDILTDIIVLVEMKDNDVNQNFKALLVFFCLAFAGMMFTNCKNQNATQYPANGFLRLIFTIFAFFGLDSIIYFIYSALTLEGHNMHDYKISGPSSPRKLWGAWQSIMSSFVTAHYLFYYPDASVWAVVSLIFSMLNARLNMNMDHTNPTFTKLLKNDIFCLRFFSTLFEIIGRPLFFGSTTIIIIQKSSFLGDDRKPFHLTYEFFAWDGILLGSVCFLFLFIYYFYFKNIKIAISLFIQNIINSMLIRPAIDNKDLSNVRIASKMVVYLNEDKIDIKQLKRQIQFGLGFPCIWRIGEYIALNYVIYHYNVLDIAEKRDDSILALTWIAGITNAINSVFLVISLVVLIIFEPKFDESMAHGQVTFVQASKQVGIEQNNNEYEVKNQNENKYKDSNQKKSSNHQSDLEKLAGVSVENE
ncbi:hypothetical protein PPERSA_04459 [Pseudocohnilembus persalinus]|uniref:Uncharacterized protein n=1 Tax=Pseudocohnilembus persalinus TaxID=266149 RepID=A0A0V0QQW4_PSEPJ|nr:hypothetical protein PPERSA_04459 [Pseudocohnilembus persalinus]|eukprot:KRX04644.1 hypothetical protein PPERSA_04459 [Pseudocohnilembus persalinus]